ncbi:acyltransferase [Flavobacterium sp. LMO8]|uniref:acyltransferase family protein n=1 Tax=Flavobacterium sp. LMO8 TaxID=2654244 RepID=UPI0013968963|nr:acyltransferase [Flavobacterium sp. LMO8]
MSTNTLRNKIFGLDVFRAIAILLVLFSHLYYVLDIPNQLVISLSGLAGFIGVEMFFVLSGFLIGRILLEQMNTNEFYFRNLIHFIKRRWYRTLPAYYFVLIINVVIAYLLSYQLNTTWRYPFFLQNLFQYQIIYFSESWSLSIEEWSYLIFPLILFLLNNWLKTTVKIKFIFSALLIIVVIHVFRFVNNATVFYEDMNLWNQNLKSIVIYRLDAIVYGFVLAWICFYYRNVILNYAVYMFIIAIHLLFLQFFVLNVLGITLIQNPIYFNVFYFTLTSISIMFLMPIFIFWNSQIFGSSVYIFVSKISYSIYLLHYSICAVLFKFFIQYYNLEIGLMLKLFIYLFLVFLLSFLLHKYIEKPFLTLRGKLKTK